MQDNFPGLLDCHCSSYMIRKNRYSIILCCVFTLFVQKVS